MFEDDVLRAEERHKEPAQLFVLLKVDGSKLEKRVREHEWCCW
jgi:hypothetical protein